MFYNGYEGKVRSDSGPRVSRSTEWTNCVCCRAGGVDTVLLVSMHGGQGLGRRRTQGSSRHVSVHRRHYHQHRRAGRRRLVPLHQGHVDAPARPLFSPTGYIRPMPNLQLCRSTLSRDKVAVCNCTHCNFVAKKTRINQSAFSAFSRQSCIEQSTAPFGWRASRVLKKLCDTPRQFCRAIKLSDKIEGVASSYKRDGSLFQMAGPE